MSTTFATSTQLKSLSSVLVILVARASTATLRASWVARVIREGPGEDDSGQRAGEGADDNEQGRSAGGAGG